MLLWCSETDSLEEARIEQQKLQAEQLQQLLCNADASKQQLADLQQKLDAAQKDLAASAGEMKLLREQQERLSAEHQGLQGRLQQEELACARLQQQLEDSRQQQQGLREELQLLEGQRGRLAMECDGVQRQLQEAQAQAKGLQRELQDSQQHGRRVQGELRTHHCSLTLLRLHCSCTTMPRHGLSPLASQMKLEVLSQGAIRKAPLGSAALCRCPEHVSSSL